MDYNPWYFSNFEGFLKRVNISEMEEPSPTKIYLNIYHVKLCIHKNFGANLFFEDFSDPWTIVHGIFTILKVFEKVQYLRNGEGFSHKNSYKHTPHQYAHAWIFLGQIHFLKIFQTHGL